MAQTKVRGGLSQLRPQDVIADELLSGIQYVSTEFTFNYDSTVPDVEVKDGAVLLTEGNDVLEAKPSGTIGLTDNTTNYIYAGKDGADTALHADTTDTGPGWPAVKVGVVDTSADSASTIPSQSQPRFQTATASFKGKPWHDVTEYGAVGDGSVDDSAAIQSAIDEASTGSGMGTVYFPTPDTSYLIDNEVTVKSDTALVSPGPWTGAKIEAGPNLGGTSAVFRNTDGFQNIRIYGLEIDGSNGWSGASYDPSQKCLFFKPGDTNDGTKNFVVEYTYCHDSPASAIGCDSIMNQHYLYNWVENAGTDGQTQGGNGIGIGVGEVTGVCPTSIVGNWVDDIAEFGIILEQTGDQEISWGYHISNNTVRDARIGIAAEHIRGLTANSNTIVTSTRTDRGMYFDTLDSTFGIKQAHISGVHIVQGTGSPDTAGFEFGSDATFCSAEGITSPTGAGFGSPINNGSFCAINGIGKEAAGTGNSPTWTDRWENVSVSQVRNIDDDTRWVPDLTGGWDQIV